MPNPTNRTLVTMKALIALVTFWMVLSLRFGLDGSLRRGEEKGRREEGRKTVISLIQH